MLCPFYFTVIHLPDPPPDYLIGIDRGEFLFVTLANIMISLKEKSFKLNERDFGQFKENMQRIVIEGRNESLQLLQKLNTQRHEQTERYMQYVGKQYLQGKQH